MCSMTHIRPAVKPSLTDFGELRSAGPRAVREAADAGEVVVDDAGVAVLFGDDLERRLAAVAEDGVAALQVLDESLHLLRLKLDLLRPLRNADRLLARRAGEEDVVGERRLHEAAGHVHARMLRTGDGLSRPVGFGQLAELFDFGGHGFGFYPERSEGSSARPARIEPKILRRFAPQDGAVRAARSTVSNTRMKFPPRIFSTSPSDMPRSSSRAVTRGSDAAVCSPSGRAGTPSKSLPMPTWSTPATSAACTM